ncbi:MAG TPA: hypothetical protein VFX84_02865 [Candidatus Saccharimonadales bacterium]|nr:hypothetical protein [Candidatus Saccharimonadales bacterium]
MLNKINAWHRTKPGLFVFGLAELAMAYGFASLSIDRGNLWWYLLTVIFLVGALQNLVKLIGGLLHDVRKPR